MNIVRKLLLKLFVIVILIFYTGILMAQGLCDDPYNPNPDDCIEEGDPYMDIPIDGGVSALLIGGAIIGYKALKRKKSEENSEEL